MASIIGRPITQPPDSAAPGNVESRCRWTFAEDVHVELGVLWRADYDQMVENTFALIGPGTPVNETPIEIDDLGEETLWWPGIRVLMTHGADYGIEVVAADIAQATAIARTVLNRLSM